MRYIKTYESFTALLPFLAGFFLVMFLKGLIKDLRSRGIIGGNKEVEITLSMFNLILKDIKSGKLKPNFNTWFGKYSIDSYFGNGDIVYIKFDENYSTLFLNLKTKKGDTSIEFDLEKNNAKVGPEKFNITEKESNKLKKILALMKKEFKS